MRTVKGATLRRQQRPSSTPSVAQGCDVPISLVFRTHHDSLSKAAFLFCPRNFNLANPTTTTTTASANDSTVTTTSHAALPRPVRGGADGTLASAVPLDASSTSPSNPRRIASAASTPNANNANATNNASTTPTRAAASTSAASVQTLVEAIVELRPFFSVTMFNSSSTMNLTSLAPGSPLAGSSSHLDQGLSSQSLMERPTSSASLTRGSYVDLMPLSSFASPTGGNNNSGSSAVPNGSFNYSGTTTANTSTGRYGEWLHANNSNPSRTAGPAGGDQRFSAASDSPTAAGGVGTTHLAGQSPLGSSAVHANVSGGGANTSSGPAGQGVGGGGGSGCSSSNNAGVAASSLIHPSGGWICRAMAFNEKEVSHANGSISVNQSLTTKCPLINEVAKGKIMARILFSYQEVQERYGLSHVEVTVDNQYVSRSDLFLISEALRERILYEGEEIHTCNFRIRVREMLQAVVNTHTPVPNNPAVAYSANSTNNTTTSYVRVGCGVVLPTTHINFQSLSPVHYIVVELSREMWDTTVDGRIALTWAIRKFISELLLKQLPKRKASPLIRVVFTGRLQPELQFGRHSDVFHVLELPREARNVDVVEEIRMHCEALVDRVLREVQLAAHRQLETEVATYCEGRVWRGDPVGSMVENEGGVSSISTNGVSTPLTKTFPDRDAAFEAYVCQRRYYIDGITAKHLFVHAKQSNTLEALSILLERCNHHYIDRHLNLSGHAVTVVSAGKGLYQVTNGLVQLVCARLHDMGLEKVHVVCIGRPPLHVTPLLEYTSDDDTLRSQYHLHSRVLSSTGVTATVPVSTTHMTVAEAERYYETPEWMTVFFFHSALSNNGGETVFELLPKECWQRQHRMMAIVDTMWSPLEQQQPPPPPQGSSSPNIGGVPVGGANNTLLKSFSQVGGEESSPYYGGGALQCGDLNKPSLASQKVGAAMNRDEFGTNMEPTHSIAVATAANPPLLIPGLGLHFYPVPDVTLPVPSATDAVTSTLASQWDTLGAFSHDGHPMSSSAVTPFTPTRTSLSHFPGVWEMFPTVSCGTEAVISPISPLSHPARFGTCRSRSIPATTGNAAAGRVSPIFVAGGAASTPLLVRTTTANSSVFASPNVSTRGSMPRGGVAAGALAMAAARREHSQHALYGANSNHIAHPAHQTTASAFPPIQPSFASTQRLSGGGGPRRGDASTWGLAQRRSRGGGVVAAAAARLPRYLSSSSIAVSAVGPGDGSRHSHPNSLTSHSTSSHHPHYSPQHISRSLDYKTTANRTCHSLGAFERSIRSAGSSLMERHYTSSPQLQQPRSLLYKENNTAKSSANSISGHPSARVGVAAPTMAAGAVSDSPARLLHLGSGGVSGPVAVCSWYCLHATKLHPEGGDGGGAVFVTTNRTAVGGNADVPSSEDPPHNNATIAAAKSSPHLGAALPAVLPSAKVWQKALSSTRTDAVCCGCNVVDSDLRNGYLILEITLNAAVLPGFVWSPRLLLDDQGWSDLMGSFTGRDDRLTLAADVDGYSDEEMEGEDSITICGSSSTTDGFINPANGARPPAPPSLSFLHGDGLLNRAGGSGMATMSGVGKDVESGGGNTTVRSNGSTSGEAYRFQSDFRAAEVFCRSHSGISVDGRTLIIPTHNNGVQFQSSEEILLRLQPHFFLTETTAKRRESVSQTSSHGVRDGPAEVEEALTVEVEGNHATSTRTTELQGERETLLTTSDGKPHPMTATTTAAATTGGIIEIGKGDDQRLADGAVQPQKAESASSGTSATTTPHDANQLPRTNHEATSPKRLLKTAAVATATTVAPRFASTSVSDGGTRGVAGTSIHSSSEVPASGTTKATASSPIHSVPLCLPRAPVAAHLSPSFSAQPKDTFHYKSPLRDDKNCFSVDRHRSCTEGPPSPFGTTHAPAEAFFLDSGAVITVGFVQLRNSLLFAIKPINPLRPSAEEEQREDITTLSQSAENASTATVLRRRWQWRHPDIASEPPHLATWTRLCTCRLLPLYGSKPAYPREGFYTVSPHQYTVTDPCSTGGHADPAEEKKRLLEFVLQRLQQQYQIVVDSPGLAAGALWPRADPTPNARLEMSLGHQTHTLKVGETAKAISITRMLHRGMYSNGQVTHMLSYRYLLWNYLSDEFATREVHMEAQVGERNAFRWEALDRWLQERPEVHIPRGPDLWLRSREVAVILLPEDPAHPPSFEEFYRFIGYRFSAHLSTPGKVEWQRHAGGLSIDIPDSTPLAFPPALSLMEVVLVHDNPLTLDTRNVMDRVTGRTVAFEVPVEEQYMSVDVSLPKQYNPQCCYFLKVSWLACAASIVADWFGSFIANASRFHFHAVPITCYYSSPKAEFLTTHYNVEATSIEEEPLLRRALAELLTSPAYRYYPDTPTITRNCRLAHLTGLCYVILPPSATMVAQWYQNACLRQGSVEQLELLVQFKEAEALARKRVAAMLGGSHP